MRGSLNLRGRMVLLTIAALLPIVVLSLWLAWRENRAATVLAQSQLRLAASLIAANQNSLMQSAEQLLTAMAASAELQRPLTRADCQPYFERLQDQHPAYANLGLISPDGRVLCHSNAQRGDFRADDRGYFIQALAERRFVVGQAVVGRASGRWSLPFALPLVREGQVVGVLLASLDLAQATATLSQIDLPAGARVLVADRHGRVLIEHPAQPERPAPRALAHPELREAARTMTAGVGEGRDVRGEPRVYAFAPSRMVGTEGFVVRVGIARDQLHTGGMQRLRDTFLVLGLTLLASALAAWWIGGRTIVHPARQILAAVRRLERGDLDARVRGPLADGGEFARIGRAFNLLAQSLQTRQAERESELARSRAAYATLEAVLDGMQEGLVVANGHGQLMLHNPAATRLFPLEDSKELLSHWPRAYGLFRPEDQTLLAPGDLPLARALNGERGQQTVLVRNAQAPAGRLLRCSFAPLRSSDGLQGALVVFSDVTDLHRIEADLVLLRNAVARLNDVVLITEAAPLEEPGPRIVFVNEAFERLTGWRRSEALGRTPRMLQGPDTDRIVLDRIRAALVAAQPVREELVNYGKGGNAYWIELDIVPVTDGQGRATHHIAVQRDVTARKQAEQALLATERELRGFTAMLERAAEAAQAITSEQMLEDLLAVVADQSRRVVEVQSTCIRLAAADPGARAITVLSQPPASARPSPLAPLPPAVEEEIRAFVTRTNRPLRLTRDALLAHPQWGAAATQESAHALLCGVLVLPLVGRDGRNIGLLQLADKVQGDFTERDEYVALELAQLASIAIENVQLLHQVRELNARLEERIAERTVALAQQEARFRALVEQAPEIVWQVDPQGRLTFISRAWQDLVGGEEDDRGWLGSMRWLERIHPDDVPDVKANWERSQRTLQAYSGTRRVRARDGRWHTTAYRAAPVLDGQGAVLFWVGIDTDITAHKRIEHALRTSNQELEAFSYSVSHDLRAPLGAIGGFSRALSQKLAAHGDDKVQHYLSRIQAGAEKMEQLIEALLSLAQLVREPLSWGPVDLSALARDVLEGLAVQEPDRTVRTHVQDGLAASGDARLLRTVLQNLLGNAWKFTAGRDEPSIEVGRRTEDGAFFVRDNGVGFDMAHAGKLFGPFQRLHTDAEFPGTGIGLATAQRVIARHQGRIWAEAEPDRGTTFYFTLPETAAQG